MGNPLLEIQRLGQSIWYDNIRRGLITSGRLQRMIEEDGLLGITSNPAIFEKAVVESSDYDQAIKALVRRSAASAVEIYERLALLDIELAADVLHPIYERTGGRDGFVSFEVAPELAHDTAGTVAYARRVHAELGRENVLIKVPGTPAGMPAVADLIADGISVNVTLLFSVDAYEACARAYMEGLERYLAGGRDPARVASVASFFISRIDTLVDRKLEAAAAADPARAERARRLRGRIAVANGIVAYHRYRELLSSERWRSLAARGARPQRVLWASTSTKDPSYSKTKYVDELIAPDTVNTIPEETWNEYRAHGRPEAGLTEGWEEKLAAAERDLAELGEVGVSLDEATDELLTEGVGKFADAFQTLLAALEQKRSLLRAA